jgi:hypothetical protein
LPQEKPTNKRAGKTKWAGRRRAATRKSGFSAQAHGSQTRSVSVDGFELQAGDCLQLEFALPDVEKGDWLGFGGWFVAPATVEVSIEDPPARSIIWNHVSPDWGKFGSLWQSTGPTGPVIVSFCARRRGMIGLYGVACGRVEHEYLRGARSALLRNMYQFAPEANFYAPNAEGDVQITAPKGAAKRNGVADLNLKSCNRCGRFLPVNFHDERKHLSFSNHCVAAHRRPCSHSGFGKLVNPETGKTINLDYGFQLECRYCKKFEVNAVHNPKRTAAQMKEDAARRRAFELLLEGLYEGTPQLRYRQETGRELADDVWDRFDGRCFKCGTPLTTPRDMALDHTRPLALLWPLDAGATALCPTHNSEKRDRPPVEYYSDEELRRLSGITGIGLAELTDPSPNMDAISRLGDRLNWFFGEFLNHEELQKVRDGKRTADLVVKALRKVLAAVPEGPPFELKPPRS